MKKVIIGCLVFLAFMTSCGTALHIVPQATNTVNAVTLNELNLHTGDYTVLETITAEATIAVKYSSNSTIEVRDVDNTFSYKMVGGVLQQTEGVIRAGYLSNDYGRVDFTYPEDLARKVAIFRIINKSQQMGADGLIEPVISTNIEESSKSTFGKELVVVYKTTVSAKPIKLKVTGK